MNLKINWAELSNVHPKQEEIVWVIWEDGVKVEIGLKRDVGLGEINEQERNWGTGVEKGIIKQ